MLSKRFEGLPLKIATAEKEQQCLRAGCFRETNQKGSMISLKKVIQSSELWMHKQQQEEAHCIQNFNYGNQISGSEIPVFIWVGLFNLQFHS